MTTVLGNNLLMQSAGQLHCRRTVPAGQPCSERSGHWHPQRFGANGQVVWGKAPALCRKIPSRCPEGSGLEDSRQLVSSAPGPEPCCWPAPAGLPAASDGANCREFGPQCPCCGRSQPRSPGLVGSFAVGLALAQRGHRSFSWSSAGPPGGLVKPSGQLS